MSIKVLSNALKAQSIFDSQNSVYYQYQTPVIPESRRCETFIRISNPKTTYYIYFLDETSFKILRFITNQKFGFSIYPAPFQN